MKKQRVQAEIIRKPGSVFVGIQPPEALQQTMAAAAQTRVWAQVAQTIAVEERAMNRTTTSQEDTPTAEPTKTNSVFSKRDELTTDVILSALHQMTAETRACDGWHDFRSIYRRLKIEYGLIEVRLLSLLWKLKYKEIIEHKIDRGDFFRIKSEPKPTADELLATSLPGLIEATRWGFYIAYGSKSYLFDDTTLVYHNPTPPFWNLYNLARGIFRDLGIRLAKSNGTWHAHIPIGVLTDKVFVASGLAGVEQTLRRGKKTSAASEISERIRHRQFEATAAGIAKVKKMRGGVV